MSAILTMEAVTRYALTHQLHFSVAVVVATHSPAMEGLAWISMSVQLAHTTVNSVVSILLVGSDVTATQDSSSTQIRELVLVS